MNKPENKQNLSRNGQAEFPKNLDEMFQLGNLPQNEFNDMLEKFGRVSAINKQEQEPKARPRVNLLTMFATVWDKTPNDCKLSLIQEIITTKGALTRRYNNEIKLQNDFDRHWKK